MSLTGSASVILVFAQVNWIFEGIETSLSICISYRVCVLKKYQLLIHARPFFFFFFETSYHLTCFSETYEVFYEHFLTILVRATCWCSVLVDGSSSNSKHLHEEKKEKLQTKYIQFGTFSDKQIKTVENNFQTMKVQTFGASHPIQDMFWVSSCLPLTNWIRGSILYHRRYGSIKM